MGSPKGKICKQDLQHWGSVAAIACTMSVLDVVGTTVVPQLENAGGTTNTILVTVLTLTVDLARRWLTDTSKNPEPTPTPSPQPDNIDTDVDNDKDNGRKVRRIGLIRRTLIRLGFSR